MKDNAQAQPIRQTRLIREIDPSAMPPAATTMVLELSVAGRGELPPVGITLPVGEAIHRGLIRNAARGKRIDCPELTGQNRLGHPLVGPHQHAHVLPVDIDRDGRIDHVVIHSCMGLGRVAVEAIHSLHSLFGKLGRPWLTLRVRNQPVTDKFLRQLVVDGHSLGATVWTSYAPFVAPRFLKRSGKNSLIGQVRAELASRGLPESEVDVLQLPAGVFREFVFQRGDNHSPPPQRFGNALMLRFSQPVHGPIALGYGSHFGLGLFEAID